MSKAYLVGFSATILWSPYYAAVGFVLLYLHVSVGHYMLYGFGFAVILLVVGNLMFVLWAQKRIPETVDQHYELISLDHRKKMKTLAILIFTLMLVTVIAESITHWSMLVLVSLLALFFPIVWSFFFKQWGALKHYLVDYRDKAVPIMNNEITMYISAGFFGQSLKGTSFGYGINEFMIHLSQVSFLLFALFIVLTAYNRSGNFALLLNNSIQPRYAIINHKE